VKLTTGQKVLVGWQIFTGLAVSPFALYFLYWSVVFWVALAVDFMTTATVDNELSSLLMSGLVTVLLIAGIVLWFAWIVLFGPPPSRKLACQIARASLVLNIALGAIFLFGAIGFSQSDPAIAFRAFYIFLPLAAYQIVIGWWWWRLFLRTPPRQPPLEANS